MNVREYVDKIFFGMGNSDYMKLLGKNGFVRSERAEMFGIAESSKFMSDNVRVLIINPENPQSSRYHAFLGNSTSGECIRLGTSAYERDFLIQFHGEIFADEHLYKLAINEDLKKAADDLKICLISTYKQVKANQQNAGYQR